MRLFVWTNYLISQKTPGVSDDDLGAATEMSDLDYEKVVKHYNCPSNCK